ncbi:Cathepsin L1 [Lamellibrachia satsuma]|nr:Cathepsin L1 [Lamellibrachia satsuma]
MKAVVFLFMVVVACSAAAPQLHGDDLDALWEMFKKVHSKNYHCLWEEQKRIHVLYPGVFHRANILYYFKSWLFRRQLKLERKGLRRFNHMHQTMTSLKRRKYLPIYSEDEFSRTMNGLRYNSSATRFTQPLAPKECNVSSLPTNVDWREKGFVTPVKNQGECGSCYAFSTTGSLEGQMFKKTGKLVSLSEKNIMDCSWKEGNEGCNGGTMDASFEYIKVNKGIDTEISYPYIPIFKQEDVGGEDVGVVDLPHTETCLQKAVATIGPISVGIYASASFQGYKDGIFYDSGCSKTHPNHGVLVVGYGSTKRGKPYWLVKNSWGHSWGIDGYIKMARNKHDMCGIAYMASYPLV